METDPVGKLLCHKGDSVETIEATASVLVAVLQMQAQRVGSVLVVRGDELIGILTERDVLRRVVAVGRDPSTTRVGEVMTSELTVIDPQVQVGEAMAIVTNRRCRHLPVVDRGRLCGLISAGDLTAWLVSEQQHTIYDLYDYITR